MGGQQRILVIGGVNMDMMVQTPRLPRPGETVAGGRFVLAPGGKGANQAIAAARLGAPVRFIGKVGRDQFGDEAVANFQRHGVDVYGLARDATEPSGIALILVDAQGENAIAQAPGANHRVTAAEVEALAPLFEGVAMVVGQFEVPAEATLAAFRLGRACGARTVLNAAPAVPLGGPWLDLVDTLIVNEGEAEVVGLAAGLHAATPEGWADGLHGLGYPQVILTLGRQGAYAVTADSQVHVPAFAVEAVDTTGAGDAFVGGLVVALAERQPMEPAVRLGCAVGALATQAVGPQESLPDRAMAQRLVERAATSLAA
ncbi:MAG: ribokinase [Dehalococcoidia bacterium]|nr:ribokinase [Dehalococcoidia bacterium]